MKQILVPTDFSEQAQYALELACALAEKSNAEVKILHIIEEPSSKSLSVQTTGAKFEDESDNAFMVLMMKRVKEKMDEIIASNNSNVTIHPLVETGNIYQSISKIVADHNVDLIVMGTQGISGFEEIFIGSNTEKVVRRADCPVISIKQKTDVNTLKDIVLAANLEEKQDHIFDSLKKLQSMLSAKIHIVKVNTPNNFDTTRSSNRKLKALAEKYKLENYSLNIYNDLSEEEGIIHFADQVNASIIAIPTHGRTGISRILTGSLAESVTNHAKRAVWTYKL